MMWHRRSVVEVAGIALATAFAGTIVVSLLMLPFGSAGEAVFRWIIPIAIFVQIGLCPCIAGFIYGLKRRLPLGLASVFVGWIVGWLAYGALVGGLVSWHRQSHRPGITPWPWLNCLLTIGELLLMSLLPTLTTMWGQRQRLRAEHPGGPIT